MKKGKRKGKEKGKKYREPTININLRCEVETIEILKRVAKECKLSFNKLVMVILRLELLRKGYLPKVIS